MCSSDLQLVSIGPPVYGANDTRSFVPFLTARATRWKRRQDDSREVAKEDAKTGMGKAAHTKPQCHEGGQGDQDGSRAVRQAHGRCAEVAKEDAKTGEDLTTEAQSTQRPDGGENSRGITSREGAKARRKTQRKMGFDVVADLRVSPGYAIVLPRCRRMLSTPEDAKTGEDFSPEAQRTQRQDGGENRRGLPHAKARSREEERGKVGKQTRRGKMGQADNKGFAYGNRSFNCTTVLLSRRSRACHIPGVFCCVITPRSV